MTMRERFQGVASAAARRPVLTLGIVLALAIAGGLLALGLEPDAGTGTFVSSSSATFKATDSDHQHFGGDAVVILIKEPLTDLVETKDLATVSQLEACLAGQVIVANNTLGSFTPAGGKQRAYGGPNSPCGHLMQAKPVQVVYGPGTFLNRAVAAVTQQVQSMIGSANTAVQRYAQAAYQLALARHLSRKQANSAASAAGQLAYQQQIQQLEQLAVQSGLTGIPRIDDPSFIRKVVFDATRGVNQPKARFSYLFPTSDSALIQARLKPGLSAAQQANAISWIRQAVKMPTFKLGYGGTYTVSGVPVVVNDLAGTISGSIASLLAAALVVMAITLLLVFRSRLRLLPLAIALAAVGITFGATSLLGGSLTMASVAVLPILIGLAVDYAIQFQSRVGEARRNEGAGLRVDRAIARAASLSMPTIATAALATATGFLVLLLSPVPMVRGFGVLLVVGIVIALACALMAGSAALALADRPGGAIRASLRGAGEIVAEAGAILAGLARPVTRLFAKLGGPARRVGDGCRIGRPRTARGGRAPAGSGARGRSAPRRPRVGRRHADVRPVGCHEARALEHAGAQGPPPARACDRRVRGDRCRGPRQERGHAEDDRLDARLRGQAALALRVPRDQGMLEGDAVSSTVVTRPVLLGGATDGERLRRLDDRFDQDAAERGAAVLLPGGDHTQSGTTLRSRSGSG